jgi:general stress protein YciG
MIPSKSAGRGFARLSPKRRREIARLGGQAAHQRGTAHQFTSDEGRAAGRKGGAAVSADRDHMARIGRIGGRRRWQREFQPEDQTVS